MGLILAALVGVALLAVPGSPVHKKATLGLDLQGGTEVVLKAIPPKGGTVTSSGMSSAQEVMRKRVDKLGLTEPEVRTQGSDQMVVELAGVNPERATKVIGTTAKLELYDLQGDLTGPSRDAQGNVATPQTSIFGLLGSQQREAKKGEPTELYLVKLTKIGKTTPYTALGDATPTRAAILAPP